METKLMDRRLKLRVFYDTDATSPIETSYDDGILGTFVCWHNNYNLGHEHNFDDGAEFWIDLVSQFNPYRAERIQEGYDEGYINYEETIETCEKWVEKEGIVVLPLYLYDHGGLTISTSKFYCPWDSGQVGYVYASKDRLKYLGLENVDAEWITNNLISEVELYDTYLRGNVYWFDIVELDEDGEEIDVIDSCSGFYGDDMNENGMIDQFDVSDEEKEQILIHGTDAYYYLVS